MHNHMVVDNLGTTFAALSDPTRRAMIKRLSHGPASVHGLTGPFALSQQMISKHIAYLVRAGMVITRVFDAPRAMVWKAWSGTQYVMQSWGPKGFTAPFCKIDFRVGGKFLCCMRAPDGQEGWNAGEYHEIVLHEKIVSSMYFSDSQGNKVEPAEYGIEHEAIDDAYDVVIFEDFGNGQTKLTFIGNESMESAKNSGQVEGWNQILDKVAAVVTKLAQAK